MTEGWERAIPSAGVRPVLNREAIQLLYHRSSARLWKPGTAPSEEERSPASVLRELRLVQTVTLWLCMNDIPVFCYSVTNHPKCTALEHFVVISYSYGG